MEHPIWLSDSVDIRIEHRFAIGDASHNQLTEEVVRGSDSHPDWRLGPFSDRLYGGGIGEVAIFRLEIEQRHANLPGVVHGFGLKPLFPHSFTHRRIDSKDEQTEDRDNPGHFEQIPFAL
ncbi:MAG: hypothetical protein EOP85_19055 [Verrucomicrobiaceae bacterium]|nr:MAG: hypothetical protein EOP85_19055 [Verrucomicrobiaceae bacterium]